MVEKERIKKVINILNSVYPRAGIALKYKDPFELLVAVILSAQCTDVRVNEVTPHLFARFPNPKAMAEAPVEDIEKIIRPTGFFRNKARNIKEAARLIVEEYNGHIPDTMEGITRLPGVARKSANIILYNVYGVIAGIAVDTHVKRLAMRLGLTREKDPIKIERDLMRIIPKDQWGVISYVLIEHGRNICNARKPLCAKCPVKELCPSAVVRP
ncbi:MAG: endonuclease III [Dissulfurimicrobium sp.]|uniref:endonuclease III n=1 Tax=Dissulfurimicrobium TaxID=1769732 RepID=UPI001EDBD9DD|nr:endonuclease III [Dissulfurimicrobium hydrothermale]UKL14237.1 endonuclease III [Dissulfurimicrobium hydrothermale]